jgi:hypothetical protein
MNVFEAAQGIVALAKVRSLGLAVGKHRGQQRI